MKYLALFIFLFFVGCSSRKKNIEPFVLNEVDDTFIKATGKAKKTNNNNAYMQRVIAQANAKSSISTI